MTSHPFSPGKQSHTRQAIPHRVRKHPLLPLSAVYFGKLPTAQDVLHAALRCFTFPAMPTQAGKQPSGSILSSPHHHHRHGTLERPPYTSKEALLVVADDACPRHSSTHQAIKRSSPPSSRCQSHTSSHIDVATTSPHTGSGHQGPACLRWPWSSLCILSTRASRYVVCCVDVGRVSSRCSEMPGVGGGIEGG